FSHQRGSVAGLRQTAKNMDVIFRATDPDRGAPLILASAREIGVQMSAKCLFFKEGLPLASRENDVNVDLHQRLWHGGSGAKVRVVSSSSSIFITRRARFQMCNPFGVQFLIAPLPRVRPTPRSQGAPDTAVPGCARGRATLRSGIEPLRGNGPTTPKG